MTSAIYEARSGSAVKVVGLITSMVPYHHARWQAFARQGGINCWVIELTDRDEFSVLEVGRNASCAYERVSLFGGRDADTLRPAEIAREIHCALDRIEPDVVCINGYASAMTFAALGWCRENCKPSVVFSESNAFDQPRTPFKEFLKAQTLRCCSAALVGGQPQGAYLVELGVPSDRVFPGYDVVDNDHFALGADRARGSRDDVRKRLSLPRRYLLACARFTAKKNHRFLINAYSRYRVTLECRSGAGATTPWDLLLIGDGPLRPAVESQIAELDLREHVQCRGAVGYAELPAYYGLASGFVHPSMVEQWGLVVNEAMASGLPVIVSERCGCVADLVAHGVNGLTFDPADQDSLAKCMVEIGEDDNRRAAMAQASREKIQDWSPDRFACGLNEGVAHALNIGPARRRWTDGLLLRILLARSG